MLNPSSLFGKEYVTAPFGQGIKNYYCLTGLKANTKVEITTNDGIKEVLLNFEGDRKYIRIDGAAKWNSNNEFQLGQFMARFAEADEYCNPFYDPAFVIIQPIDYFNNNLNFKAIGYDESNYGKTKLIVCGENYEVNQYNNHYVMIISKDEARYNTMIDGWNYDVTNYEGTVPGTDYYFGYIEVEPGEHEIYAPEGGFQAIIYGRGYFDSYAYSLGGANAPDSLKDRSAPELLVNNDCDEVIFDIFDEGENLSGIQFIEYLVADNVEINEEIINENERKITVKHKDKRNNAQIILDYFDNAGNGRRYVHKFDGVDPVIIDKSLGTIDYNPNTVYSTNLINNGSNTITIYNIYFDSEEFLLNEQFEEITLAPNEEYEIEFVIMTNNVLDLPNEVNLIAESNCNVSDTAKVYLSVASVGFTGVGIDLGGVPLGTEKCGIVYFENQGDLNLKIDDVKLSESEINAKLEGILNKNINITDRQNIEVCVTPMDRNVNVLDIEMIVSATYYGTDSIVNSKTLSDIVSVTYTPLGGIFENKEYTFDDIFVNQSAQVEIEIVNTGNYESSVTYNILTEETSNGKLSLKNDEVKLQVEGEYQSDIPKKFTFHFEPTKPGYYENIITFFYNEGAFIRQFDITLKGTAINSKVTPIDNCFEDTVYVGKTVTKNFPYLEYEGDIDRDLVIVNRYLSVHTDLITNVSTTISHNENAIDFLNGINHPTLITDGDTIYHDFSFTPTRAGKFELQIISIVNTLTEGKIPPFDSVYSTICGIAAEPIFPELEIVIDTEDVWACDTANGNVSITNIGETDVIMEEIDVISNFYTASTFSKPQILKMGNTYNIPLELFRFRDEVEEIEVFIRATDYIGRHSTTFSEKKLIEPSFTQLILPDLEFNYTIGDSSVVNLYGEVPYNIDIPAKLTIQLEVDYQLLWLLTENAELVLTSSGGGTQRIPVTIRKNETNPKILEFDIDFFEFDVYPEQRWSLDLSFRIMLASFTETEFKVNVIYDECFASNEKNYPIKVEEVCFQYFRNVENFDVGDIKSHYDYEKSELLVNLDIPDNSSYSIYLIDMLGKKINIEEKKFVNIGKYFLNYDLKNFPNGNYFLNIETKHLKERKKIIILK